MSSDNVMERRKRDFEDYHHELAGVDTGRYQRFLSGSRDTPELERKKRKERAFRTLLQELMANPVYRARNEAVMTVLQTAEQATETALDQLQRAIDAAQTDLQDLEARAARLPDQSLVFRDAKGVVRKANGSPVSDDLAATILWTGLEPSFEDHTAQQAHLDALNARLTATRAYQADVLGAARDWMTDPDNPPSLEDLDAIEKRIETEMPSAVQQHLPEADTEGLSMNVALPSLGGKP